MNKIVASIGLVALGASTLQAAPVPGKPWNVSLTLRGFYDDNINTVSDGSKFHDDSLGFEARPAINLNLGGDQTDVMLGYAYSFRYFDTRPAGNTENYDQDHIFNGVLNHAFNERYQLSVRDTLVIGQEPERLRDEATGAVGLGAQRIPGDNIRNHGAITLNGWVTPLLGFEAGYANSFTDYEARSISRTFDRMEHKAHLDGRWRVQPPTVALVGYEYGLVDYTADLMLATGGRSDIRNRRSHALYVGADHNFRPDLSASVRLGGKFVDHYNLDGDSVNPYVRASMRYTYAPESYLEAGGSYDVTSTDVIGVGGTPVRDMDTGILFASIYHRLTPRLFGNLMGQVQNSTFNGGSADGRDELYYKAGVNLEYFLGPNLSTQVGYNFDSIDSDIGRDYDRNRVYIGVTASY